VTNQPSTPQGVIDKGRFSLRTPAYGFGWLLSSVEALNIFDGALMELLQLQLPRVVEKRIDAHWQMKKYDKRCYK
jgi:hypothetical protein